MADPTTDPTQQRAVDSAKVWTTLITNTAYLSGLLTLDASLKFVGSKYPLVALYTDTFPPEGHAALDLRQIPKQRVAYLLPAVRKDFSHDPRFYDCWSKLTPFSLTAYSRVVQLDSDMLVRRNMDELMELPLDDDAAVFAASHACVCNPLAKPHYPSDWIPANCAYTSQHAHGPAAAAVDGAPPTAGLGMPNGGLQVVTPSAATYARILARLAADTDDDRAATAGYDFADQSLLSDVFRGRWRPLPYTYNALKTLRWPGVHDAIWEDEAVKNVHYILSPKPWDESEADKRKPDRDPTHAWWWEADERRRAEEKARGIDDGF